MTTSVQEIVVSLAVNGIVAEVSVDPRRNLTDVLRRDLGLTGTTSGCDLGTCGSCTVLVDGEPVRSCLMLAVEADGSTIETVEGLAQSGELSSLQRALADHGGLQCGFCTPGFLMLSTELLRREPCASRARITEELSGNLCRCTGYGTIVDAVHSCSQVAS